MCSCILTALLAYFNSLRFLRKIFRALRPSFPHYRIPITTSIIRNPFITSLSLLQSRCRKRPLQKASLSKSQLQDIHFPSFPTSKYNFILCDAPQHYDHVTPLTPSYRTMTFSQLKQLPIRQISAQDCIFLYWSTGPMLYQSIQLAKHYGFRHLTVLHVWRKLNSKDQPHISATHKASLTQPSTEFLIVAVKGQYKKLQHSSIPNIYQEQSSKVRAHSQKPSAIYSTIKKIVKVYSFPCMELFAHCQSHPYFDIYGDQVPQYFQRSTKSIFSTAISSKPTTIPNELFSAISKFPIEIKDKLTTLGKSIWLKGSQLQQVLSFLSSRLSLFAWDSHEVGKMSNLYHKINTLPNSTPKAFKPYRLSHTDRAFVEKEISELLRLGYIKSSASPWAAPVMVVPKDGGKRLVIDFRYLNDQTIKEHWPLSNFEDFLAYLPNARIMSKLDLRSGFFNQVLASDLDEQKASFVCHLGQFSCKRLWFGLANAPSSFQRAIIDALGPLVCRTCLVYIDDILIFFKSFDEHLIHLDQVLKCLFKANVKLHPSKCTFFTTTCSFLGHTISNGTISPKLKRHDLVLNMTPPTTKTQVKSFLGLLSYYRRFIPNFASIAQPLTALLSKDVTFQWTILQQQAFSSLRTLLLALPSLYLSKPNLTFSLSTNFSNKGLGAILHQLDQDKQELPISFISRILSKHEKNYSSYEGEVLAVIFALSKFRHFLLGRKFILHTDNKALQHVLSNKSPSPKLNRWLLFLSEYDFIVVHKKGTDNSHADALSRLAPLSINTISYTHNPRRVRFILKPSIRIIRDTRFQTRLLKRYRQFQRRSFLSPFLPKSILRSTKRQSQISSVSVFHREPYSPIDLPNLPRQKCKKTSQGSSMQICELCCNGFHKACFPPMPKHIPSKFYYCTSCITFLSNLTSKDPILAFQLLTYLKSNRLPPSFIARERVLRLSKYFYYKHGTHFTFLQNQSKVFPTIVARKQLIYELHDNCGHLGVVKTTNLINTKCHWSSIRQDVAYHINNCSLCIAQKNRFRTSPALQPLPIGSTPFQYWHVDLLTNLPESLEGFKHILICIDSFSKWLELISLKTKSSMEIAHGFYRDTTCRYGKPQAVRCDNGTEFQSEFSSLLQYILTLQKTTNPYWPRAKGQAERYVRSTINFLRNTLHSHQDILNSWPLSLPTVCYTLHMSPQQSHGQTPFQILHGYNPTLIDPLSQICNSIPIESSTTDIQNYVQSLQKFQIQAFQRTFNNLQSTSKKSKATYESKTRPKPYQFNVNDLVFSNTGNRITKLQLPSEGPFLIKRFINKNTVILQDLSNNSEVQNTVYNIVPLNVLRNELLDQVNLEAQPFEYHRRPSNSKRGRPKKFQLKLKI